MAQHVIEHIILNANLRNNNQQEEIQQRLEYALLDALDTNLSSTFDALSGDEAYTYIDKLQVNLGNISPDFNEHHIRTIISREITTQLKKVIKESRKTAGKPSKNPSFSPLEVFVKYLHTGEIPWWYDIDERDLFTRSWMEANLIENASVLRNRITASLKEASSLWRLMVHLPESGRDYILKKVLPGFSKSEFTALEKELKYSLQVLFSMPPELTQELHPLLEISLIKYSFAHHHFPGNGGERQNFILNYLMPTLTSDTNRVDKLRHLFREGKEEIPTSEKQLKGARTKKWVKAFSKVLKNPKEFPNENDFTSGESEAINELQPQNAVSEENSWETIYESHILENAGLVILHPFLLSLFTELSIIDPQEPNKIKHLEKGIAVLAYLVSGKESLPEYRLGFIKILLGIQTNTPPGIIPSLTREEKNECDTLLKAVIKHWSKLKNTSPEGLREAFLSRAGKFSEVEERIEIQMEKETIDVLLSYLPWSISIIKLPWMKYTIMVNWQ